MKRILFESFKGGTGVTTCAVRLGIALASLGERVLYVDGDARCGGGLIAAGCANMQVYTLGDYERGACRAKQAMLAHPLSGNFYIMPTLGLRDRAVADRAVSEVEGLFDYVLLDKVAHSRCDGAVIISEPYLASLKSADICRAMLADNGIREIYLMVNKLNGGQVISGEVPTAEEAAALLRIPLIAVVPEDLLIATGSIKPATTKAFRLAAERVCGRRDGVCNVVKPYFGLHGYFKRRMREKV